ncbi:MAG TPA: hypothetical protein PLE19_05885 [Planctomycetota bacterium]|nr:hypothetical protein [Planctomycetota bacterium]HRR80252.1 hypothetical protein [Planctomycetota bacterium]HRT95616.1 hypothetical protein [Planctomycetota bacterium]
MALATRAVSALAAHLALALGAAAAGAAEPTPAVAPPAPAPIEAPKEAEPAAPAKEWSVALDSTFNSAYVWRGLRLNDEAVWQPSVSASWKGFTATLWGNVDLTDRNQEKRHVSEIDYSLEYGWSCDRLKFVVGAVRYEYPNTSFDGTTEVYASVGVDTLLSPTLKVWRDVDLVKGAYGALMVSHTFADVARLSKAASLSLDCQGSVGYGSHRHNLAYYGLARAAAADATFGLGLPIQVGDHWRIRPSLNFTHILDGAAARSMGYRDTFWVGLSTTFSF